jgi:hypothetical protein
MYLAHQESLKKSQRLLAVWLLRQSIGPRSAIGHVQIYLRSGRRIYRQLLRRTMPPGFAPWDLSGCDFRAGDIGDVAARACLSSEAV